jgi:coenzyme PQQ biosynthesis protein PqqD
MGEEESVLLNVQSEEYYSLNEVGTRTWELIDGHRSVEEIAATLAEEYEAPLADIEADVRALLQDFREQGLLD